ncbi:hypothetical protein NF548_004298, partial [Cronobacter sakazakii]|nr:hypothetical protein [Cronobacter sakazakii]
KKTDNTYTLKSLQLNSCMPLTIINEKIEDNRLKLKLSLELVFKADEMSKEILGGLIKAGYSLQEDSPCKLISTIENDNELKAELVVFYTDYAAVFSEADRKEKYKESDIKLIVLSMLTDLYSCSMGINDFISKTLESAIKHVKKGLKDEKEQ